MDFIAQLVSMDGASGMMAILLIGGFGLLAILLVNGWGGRELDKKYRIPLLIFVIAIFIISGVCFIAYAFYNPTVAAGTSQTPLNRSPLITIDENISSYKVLTVFMASSLPIGVVLLLIAIIFAQKLTDKQQGELRLFGWILIIIGGLSI